MMAPCEIEAVRWAAIEALEREADTLVTPQELDITGPYRKFFRRVCYVECRAFPETEVAVMIDRVGLPFKAIVYTE